MIGGQISGRIEAGGVTGPMKTVPRGQRSTA
jgi:hypothetical protein